MREEISKRWRWLGVEFVVIMLGVLAALFVDTWVEDRENTRKAADYRQRLTADLKQDIQNIDAVIDYYEGIRTYGLLTLEDLEGRRRLEDFDLLLAAFNAAEEWGFSLESGTYSDLQNTGGLALLDDVEFRLALSNYHRQAITRGEVWALPSRYRELARGVIPNALQAAIHESCVADPNDLLPLKATGTTGAHTSAAIQPLTGSAAPGGVCGLDPQDFDLVRAAEELRQDAEIERELRYRTSEARVSVALFKGQKVMAQELLERLESSE
jgi:hypothetical protein